ncbi:MAG: Na+/H+ antiporter [Luteimonas sp.]|nr:Na+/H+ antiporter [Luteimonas sp.]
MASIELVLAMLLAVLASGYLQRVLPLSLPLPLVQIALGAVISGVFNEGVTLAPGIFFLLFLPPLLFLDGWRIPKDGLFRDSNVILPLAFGLVVFTVVGAGLLIHWMIPAMPLPVAFALAAILSPTDPVAVSSIAKRAPVPKRLMHILEGESLLNDASGLVCFRFAVAAAMTGSFSLAKASMTFIWVAVVGVAIGIGFTLLVSRAQNWLSRRFGEESGTPILISLLMPYGAYLVAEEANASGILAAVSAGITMSFVELTGRALATTRVQRAAVWDMLQFTLNGVIFVLLGEQLPGILRNAAESVQEAGHANPWWLAVYALALTFGLVALRMAWVWVSLRLDAYSARRRGEVRRNPHWRVVAAASLAGVRGAITLAGVLSLPLLLPGGGQFPARDLAIFLAASVILLSLVAASVGLPRLLVGLQLPEDAGDQQQLDLARREGAAAAIAAIDRAQHAIPVDSADTDLYAQAAVRVMALYQQRVADRSGTAIDAATLRKADRAERELRLAGLEAERRRVYELARHRQISDEVARRVVRGIDLLEARYRV